MNLSISLIVVIIVTSPQYTNCLFFYPFFRRGGGRLRQPRQNLARGVREAIFAVNAFCDDNCATDDQQAQVVNCIQNGINTNQQIVNILRGCTPGGNISCNRGQRGQMNRCLIGRTIGRRNLMNRRLQRCFRNSVSLATIDCLVNRYRILRNLLPIPPGPAGPVQSGGGGGGAASAPAFKAPKPTTPSKSSKKTQKSSKRG